MKLEYSTDYSAPTDVSDWTNTDQTLVRPVTPGAMLVRLCQVSGGLQNHPDVARLLPAEAPSNLQKHRQSLLEALEAHSYPQLSQTLHNAQDEMLRLYISLGQPLLEGEASTDEAAKRVKQLAALGFPDPRETAVQPVDTASVIPTFALIRGQVVTTLHFAEAHNATGYRLHEVRYFGEGERAEDPLIESSAPIFSRVRLALGTRHLRIKSRNTDFTTVSDEFTIEVPDLT